MRDLATYRITELPRRGAAAGEDDAATGEDWDPRRALTAAYHASPAPVAFGWIRPRTAGPVHVVFSGVQPPGGARGTALPPWTLGRLLDEIGCWREVAVISDGLLAGDDDDHATPRGMTLEQCLLGSHVGPFGWMVVAAPLTEPALRTLATDVARRLHLAQSAAGRFPERAADARRLAARHAELRRGVSAGFWRIRIAAGGPDSAAAAGVAGVLCASTDLDALPYALVPTGVGRAAEGWAGSEEDGSTELLAALFRTPETEIPGVRLTLRPEFDVTPDASAAEPSAAIRLGDILDRNLMPAGSLCIPLESLNRHVFVCGATGAGKSHTVRSMLEAAASHGIPWLVVEPAKAEYRLMANRLSAEVIRIRPGEPDAIAAGLNPLEPAAADGGVFPLQTHADLVRALFIASFRSEEPFPQVLSAALTRTYEEAGWDLALGEPRAGSCVYPALADLQRAAESVVAEIGYSQRVTDDVLGFIRVRIASLRAGTTGRFLEGGHPVDFGRLLERNAVLEIEDVGDDRDKAFLMGSVLIRLAEHLRLTRFSGQPSSLRHLTVIEEAHRLLRRTEPGGEQGAGAHAVEMFADLLAEIRAYGEGLIIAEQIPARVIPDVAKNTAVKIVHRLPAADDRGSIGATMNLTPAQSRYLVTLPPGQAAVFADGMDYPMLVAIADSSEREFAAVPPAADCASVVTQRSGGCGAACRARPCTLREMRRAQRLLEEYPWLRLWAELAVAAHLAGWPMPVPVPAVAAGLTRALSAGAVGGLSGAVGGLSGMESWRLVRCAVAHAVDAAITARLPVVGDPGGLAAHTATAIAARVRRQTWLCGTQEPRWRLPGPVTQTAVLGLLRPSVIESEGRLLPDFVACRWPFRYLPRLPTPVVTAAVHKVVHSHA